jgi:hypothetical protein
LLAKKIDMHLLKRLFAVIDGKLNANSPEHLTSPYRLCFFLDLRMLNERGFAAIQVGLAVE